MGYYHINNLYKDQDILMFKECYALEKIHGTSAHISWNKGKLGFFSGGENYERFVELFDHDSLVQKFTEMGRDKVIVYGEAYGGNQQGMRHTYGDALRFIVFDVQIDDMWVDVPKAASVASFLNLDFVEYVQINTNIETLNYWRDMPSAQAVRNGIAEPKPREGVVLRPLVELTKNNGRRIIAKHKAEAFQETKRTRNLDAESLAILSDATEIADEWVTEMRLSHVLDGFHGETGIELTSKVIAAMIEDVKREAEGEIVFSKEAIKAISRATSTMFKRRLQQSLAA